MASVSISIALVVSPLKWYANASVSRKLGVFQSYYNSERVHQSHGGKTPDEVGGAAQLPCANLHSFSWDSTCDGLVELPKAA